MGTDSGAEIPVNADVEQAQRDADREKAAREHNEKTGGGTIEPGEVERARREHNERTGGGPVY